MAKNDTELELAKRVAKKAKELAKEQQAHLLSSIRAEFYEQLSAVLASGKVDASTWHIGSGKPATLSGNSNDLYLDTDSADIFHKEAGSWVKVLNIKPADGRDGVDGKEGERGKVGLAGRDGKNGRDGKDGKDGKNGIDGKNGKDGKDGRDGKDGVDGSRWFTDRGFPNYSLGSVGDFYLDNSTAKYYEKVTPIKWEFKGSLKGSIGATGLRGEKGDAGEGVPAGGTAGQILAKINDTDFATEWIDAVGGVPDEAYTIVDISDKILGNIPASQSGEYITGIEAELAYIRIGRTVKGILTIVIPSDAVWPDGDPFFPIQVVAIKATDLPYRPKIYPAIGGIAPPQPGGFGLFNVNTDGDEGVGDGFAVGSVTTDFGGSLANNGILSFFHASNNTTTQLTNLVYHGNFVNLIGRGTVIYSRIEYEAAYAIGEEPE